jgi:hypothetical protein
MTAITNVIGREIHDSRGNPTVEVDVVLADGCKGRVGSASASPAPRGYGGTAIRYWRVTGALGGTTPTGGAIAPGGGFAGGDALRAGCPGRVGFDGVASRPASPDPPAFGGALSVAPIVG